MNSPRSRANVPACHCSTRSSLKVGVHSPSAASPLRQNPNFVCSDCTAKPWETDDRARIRRVRYHLLQAALWAPHSQGERRLSGCDDGTTWEDTVATRRPDASGLTAPAVEETGTIADTLVLVQAPPPPILVTAAPGGLRQAPPSSLLQV